MGIWRTQVNPLQQKKSRMMVTCPLPPPRLLRVDLPQEAEVGRSDPPLCSPQGVDTLPPSPGKARAASPGQRAPFPGVQIEQSLFICRRASGSPFVGMEGLWFPHLWPLFQSSLSCSLTSIYDLLLRVSPLRLRLFLEQAPSNIIRTSNTCWTPRVRGQHETKQHPSLLGASIQSPGAG